MPKPMASSATRSTAATAVYERIRSDILAGRLEPGLKLRIDQVAKRYGVGSSPVREALNRLCSDAIVERREHRGFYVAEVSVHELRELVKTRLWLESIALRESIANSSQAWEEGLVLAFHRLSRTPRSRSEGAYDHNPDWEARHAEFHDALISNCGSTQLLKYCQDLRNKSDRYRLLAAPSVSSRKEQDEHRTIFEAAIAGDTDRAIELLSSHYTVTQTVIEKRYFEP